MTRQDYAKSFAALAIITMIASGNASAADRIKNSSRTVQQGQYETTDSGSGNGIVQAGHLRMSEFRYSNTHPHDQFNSRKNWRQPLRSLHKSHKEDSDAALGWFCYIKGHGPAIWIHDE